MLQKFKYHVFLVPLMVVLLYSCGKESSCFKGTGDIITEQRAITNDILTIKTADNVDLVITQGNEASLTLEGGENLLPYVNTDISGDLLTINSDNQCGFFRDYNIPLTAYLTIPNLTTINFTGQGNITSTNTLNFPEFRLETYKGTGSINLNMNANNISVVQHTGPADITITGTTTNLYTYLGETGWQYLNNLNATNAHVNNGGSGDIAVSVSNNFLVELTGTGNIDYYNNPNNITIAVHTGSGQVRKK